MSSKEQQSDSSRVFNIELSLVDISQTLRDDASADKLPAMLASIVDTLSCSSAETFLSPPPPESNNSWVSFFQGSAKKSDDEDMASKFKTQVVRFMKPPDKYISLTSILLKSQAFHKVYSIEQAKEKDDAFLPVIELPRTEYRKPYIPSPKKKHDSFFEVNLYPFSVSHQFPFVGLARLVIHNASELLSNRPLVGLDVVTFDDYNPRLYDSVQSFVEVFQTSFSPWEWEQIHTRADAILQEFYLRWAMKEAYTKALGVGMGLSFDSFETTLEGLGGKGIYSWLEEKMRGEQAETPRCAFFLSGTVIQKPNTPDSKSEKCAFLFCPLWERTAKHLMGSERGCACLCLLHPSLEGEQSPSVAFPSFEFDADWLSLEELVEWHKRAFIQDRH
jgi:phosphopantetheinyl transferase